MDLPQIQHDAYTCSVATCKLRHCPAKVCNLRVFRDQFTHKTWYGRCFIAAYSRLYPPAAAAIEKSFILRTLVRWFIVGPAFTIAQSLPRTRNDSAESSCLESHQ